MPRRSKPRGDNWWLKWLGMTDWRLSQLHASCPRPYPPSAAPPLPLQPSFDRKQEAARPVSVLAPGRQKSVEWHQVLANGGGRITKLCWQCFFLIRSSTLHGAHFLIFSLPWSLIHVLLLHLKVTGMRSGHLTSRRHILHRGDSE